jgi:hypothetical protein
MSDLCTRAAVNRPNTDISEVMTAIAGKPVIARAGRDAHSIAKGGHQSINLLMTELGPKAKCQLTVFVDRIADTPCAN